MKNNQPPNIILPDLEEPIRAELFSIERLEQHAESLAAAQIVTTVVSRGRPLLPRVLENGRVLLDSYRATARAIQEEHAITPAAEWLVDNFHIVDEQLREIRDDLPSGYYRKLPKLASGHLQGYPRVYGVAWAFVAHTDSRFDPEVLRRFVTAYQRVQPLTIGELWAVAISLRVVLVENLRRMADRIVRSRAARHEADALADHLLRSKGQAEILPELALRQFEKAPLERAFAVQLVQRLRDLDPKVGPCWPGLISGWPRREQAPMKWSEPNISNKDGMNVSVRNIITSMRLISEFDWQQFVESVSLVDEILRNDTHFASMDFPTRDIYRHAIEDLARGSNHSELEVARRVVRRVKQAASGTSDGAHDGDKSNQERHTEPGYHLISRGRPAFEQEFGFHVSGKRWLLRLYIRAAVPGYLGTIAIVTVLILALPLLRVARERYDRARPLAPRIARSCAGLGSGNCIDQPLSDGFAWAAKAAANGVAQRHPGELANDRRHAHAADHPEEVAEQVERLEVHYLANPDGDLRFALLSDWMDAPCETLPGDDDLLARAVERNRAAEQEIWSGPRRRRTLFSLPPQACMERERRQMDGLGAQARKAA